MKVLTGIIAVMALYVGLIVSAQAANQSLCDEISIDPLGRGYSAMTPEQVTADINSEYRTQWKECVEGTVLLDAISEGDWIAVTDAERDRSLMLMSIGCLDPQGNAREILKGIFGNGSQTIANMVALAREPISRANELDLGRVRTGQVQECLP